MENKVPQLCPQGVLVGNKNGTVWHTRFVLTFGRFGEIKAALSKAIDCVIETVVITSANSRFEDL